MTYCQELLNNLKNAYVEREHLGKMIIWKCYIISSKNDDILKYSKNIVLKMGFIWWIRYLNFIKCRDLNGGLEMKIT